MKKVLFLLMMPVMCFGQVKVELTEKKTLKTTRKSEANVVIKVPITVDLNNYTHIAIINSGVGNNGIKSTYDNLERELVDGPFAVLNPFVVDKKRAKKDGTMFLRETKNPNWLYFYYSVSRQGEDYEDYVRRIIIKDYQNNILYNVSSINARIYEMVEPILFF